MSNKLVTVATLEHINQAIMMKGWLDSAGIESYILDQGLSVEAAAQLEGRVELQVCEIDVTKALEVIENGNIPDKQKTEFSVFDNQLINKILVPVDFSSYSLNAACYAAQVAQQKGAEITLIHVYFNPITNPISYDHFYSFPANVAETLNEIVENADELMKELRAKLNSYMIENELLAIQIKTEVIGGIAEEAILDFAEIGQFDLMVVGIRGKDSSENWFGSFMAEIINKSSIPVLAIPGQAIYKKSMFKRLMYATNFDKSDGTAIRKLIEIAKPLETHITIVHIDETSENPFLNFDLSHFKEKFVGNVGPVEMDFDLIVNNNRSRGIENYIIDEKIDVIAITSHKRNIITSLFRPSLTKELLFRLEIPMLIFHPEIK
ncbi:MAG TPA: universal stress protein [Prolixibacteraceae bacterium]|nr:universal stress protein [Prolixibacteraceae bacterium]